ncbi:hypothetical protein CSKR_108396 [Clonorchis sinensis]|uniref:Uncharacterized protein n=1 Tax=Clonorchis sinensis TaxID=79923 RepID=A0A419PRG6_CLOSI|nr:hypothetical protein CSKR_108396 [Clonorchis sinensis]
MARHQCSTPMLRYHTTMVYLKALFVSNQAQWGSRGPHHGRRVAPTAPKLFGKQHPLRQTMVRHAQHMSQPTQLLVLDTFFNGSTRCTTQNSLSNCLVTDSWTPSHTSYGSETTIVERLKTSKFRCSNRPSLTAIQQNSPHCSLIHTTRNPSRDLICHTSSRYAKHSTTSSASLWIVSSMFRSMTLHFVGARCIPKDRMTLNDVICIFQIDKVFVTGYLNTGVLETFQRSSHYFVDHEVEKEWREWASLTDTTLCTEAFRELTVYSHTSVSLGIQRAYYVHEPPGIP